MSLTGLEQAVAHVAGQAEQARDPTAKAGGQGRRVLGAHSEFLLQPAETTIPVAVEHPGSGFDGAAHHPGHPFSSLRHLMEQFSELVEERRDDRRGNDDRYQDKGQETQPQSQRAAALQPLLHRSHQGADRHRQDHGRKDQHHGFAQAPQQQAGGQQHCRNLCTHLDDDSSGKVATLVGNSTKEK
jgi:hypothetical protein